MISARLVSYCCPTSWSPMRRFATRPEHGRLRAPGGCGELARQPDLCLAVPSDRAIKSRVREYWLTFTEVGLRVNKPTFGSRPNGRTRVHFPRARRLRSLLLNLSCCCCCCCVICRLELDLFLSSIWPARQQFPSIRSNQTGSNPVDSKDERDGGNDFQRARFFCETPPRGIH